MTAVASTGHLLLHQFLRTRRVWWSILISGLVYPIMFLLAIGAGIGTQIDDAELARLGADSYMAWIGPGILAVSAMQLSAQEGMWPTMGLIKWEGTYRSILRTPMALSDLGIAHNVWIAVRAMVTAICFLVVLVIAGVTDSPWALFVPLLAAVIALVHGAPISAFTTRQEHDHWFPAISRVVIFPLFIFSGAFFPVDEMPTALAAIARFTPSWHGVQAARHLVTGQVTAHTLGHVALLVALAVVGVWVAQRAFVRNVEA